ncbi:MAG TPA: riboflavin synthase [Gemmatimonadales bacterium]|nr:riboflavin synthase [Gemmatimonadales bacterium]
MFTGIVTAVGTIRAAESGPEGLSLVIRESYRGLRRGESIAIDGACLTVERSGPGWFRVHVIRTSLERTLFLEYARGRRVNLERALRVGDRLGGHIVQGHVDGIGRVRERASRGDAVLLDIEAPVEVSQVSIPLGSITVDGVSLTVNAVPGTGIIQVSLIPFTFKHTTLGSRMPGDRVHLEGDTIGKYVRSLLEERQRRPGGGVDREPLESP